MLLFFIQMCYNLFVVEVFKTSFTSQKKARTFKEEKYVEI